MPVGDIIEDQALERSRKARRKSERVNQDAAQLVSIVKAIDCISTDLGLPNLLVNTVLATTPKVNVTYLDIDVCN